MVHILLINKKFMLKTILNYYAIELKLSTELEFKTMKLLMISITLC